MLFEYTDENAKHENKLQTHPAQTRYLSDLRLTNWLFDLQKNQLLFSTIQDYFAQNVWDG